MNSLDLPPKVRIVRLSRRLTDFNAGVVLAVGCDISSSPSEPIARSVSRWHEVGWWLFRSLNCQRPSSKLVHSPIVTASDCEVADYLHSWVACLASYFKAPSSQLRAPCSVLAYWPLTQQHTDGSGMPPSCWAEHLHQLAFCGLGLSRDVSHRN